MGVGGFGIEDGKYWCVRPFASGIKERVWICFAIGELGLDKDCLDFGLKEIVNGCRMVYG